MSYMVVQRLPAISPLHYSPASLGSVATPIGYASPSTLRLSVPSPRGPVQIEAANPPPQFWDSAGRALKVAGAGVAVAAILWGGAKLIQVLREG